MNKTNETNKEYKNHFTTIDPTKKSLQELI